MLKGCRKVSPQPAPLQAEQPQLSQPLFIVDVVQESLAEILSGNTGGILPTSLSNMASSEERSLYFRRNC